MKSLRRLALLGAFAAVGVGIALGLGFSIAPPIAETASSADVDRSTRPSTVSPVTVPTSPIETPSAAPAPSQYVPVSPNLALANQAPPPPESNSSKLGPLLKTLLQAAAPNGAAEVVPTPPAQVPPAPDAARPAEAKPAPPKAKITPSTAEGDNRLTINIQDADIREVLDMLSQQGNLNILASANVKGKVSAALGGVDLDSALAAILKSTGFQFRREGKFIFVGTADDFKMMEESADKIGTRVYRPNYVTSKELQTLVSPLLTKGVGVTSITTEAKSGIPSNMTDAGGDAYAGAEALLVHDYETILAQVDQLIDEVDVRPMQVHIEAMILSVQLDDKDNFGVNFQLLRQNDHLKFGWGTVPASLATFKFDGGLKLGFLDDNLGAFLDAIEKIGDTNVIATPRLMVLNKHAAEIQIGKSKGYVSTTQQTETAATQTVEFLELGTLLRIRPFITRDGMIRMEVHPEISDGDVQVEQGYTLPNKEVTQVTTNIMVRDGCTVVIGGLLQDEQKVNRTQIPLLGNLPVVGFVFRNKDENAVRRELIILITPNIVYEPGAYREGDHAACDFQRRHSTYGEKMCPISKRSLGRRWARKAQAAYAAGDRDQALRLAEMAVNFDPRNRDSIELRSNIWLGKPCDKLNFEEPAAEEPAGEQPAPDQPDTAAMDGKTIAPWVLEGLGGGSPPPAPPRHPLDPGVPGDHRDLAPPEAPQ